MLHAALIALALAGFTSAAPLADEAGTTIALEYHGDFTHVNGTVNDAAVILHNAYVHE